MHLEDYVGFLNFSCVGQRWAKRSYKTAWTTGGLSNILVGYQVSFRVGKLVPFKIWWDNRFIGLTDGSILYYYSQPAPTLYRGRLKRLWPGCINTAGKLRQNW